MQVLLIDADGDNLKNFRTYLRGAFPDVKIAGAVSDLGKDLAAAIRETKPDLILADIKFFGGVRFARLRDIHNEFPDIRLIVYGTYDETDYMKRAREFGVIDYMYRPVKPVELARCIKTAAAHFKRAEDQKRQSGSLARYYEDNLTQYEGMFLRGLAEGHIRNENEIREGFSYFGINTSEGYSVGNVHIDHFRQVALTMTEREKHLLIYRIQQTAREVLREREAVVVMMSFHSVAVILGGTREAEEKVSLFEDVKRAVYDKTGIRVSVGIGRTYGGLTEIAVSYREATAALCYRSRVGYNTVIPLEFVEPDNHITYRYPADREERLVHTAVIGDYDYCRSILTGLFDALARSEPLPDMLIPRVILDIVIRISRCATEQNLPFSDGITRCFPTAEILAVRTLEEGRAILERSLSAFCAYVREYEEQTYGRLLDDAKRYIAARFAEPFSAARVALSLGATTEYLNKVFNAKERMTLFEYVMNARMDEARRLLRETDAPEEYVAAQAGFGDVKYFRSMFKRYEGVGPAEYREAGERG
jgi:two-component system response regulator YesN